MSPLRLILLTALTMTAFAGNSLLCRLALTRSTIDPASFTALRIASGALALLVLVRWRTGSFRPAGSWPASFALATYAAGFSFAYLSLPAGSGALILFGAVQATMIGYGLYRGERLRRPQLAGLLLACGGLVGLLLPGLAAPPLGGALLMLAAGAAWGVYSLCGRGEDPLAATTGNFLRAAVLTLLLALLFLVRARLDVPGCGYAIASGALASAGAYVLWYTVLRHLTAATAAVVQLSVPVLAALGGILFLAERPSLRLLLASVAILGGIALVIRGRRPQPGTGR